MLNRLINFLRWCLIFLWNWLWNSFDRLFLVIIVYLNWILLFCLSLNDWIFSSFFFFFNWLLLILFDGVWSLGLVFVIIWKNWIFFLFDHFNLFLLFWLNLCKIFFVIFCRLFIFCHWLFERILRLSLGNFRLLLR
jgi:hypothetical protein